MTEPLLSSVSLENSSPSPPSDTTWQAAFLAMLPKIQGHAAFRFRHLPADHREENVQEVLANACVAFARLAARGMAGSATWSSLAKFAIRQVRAGRRVGGSLNKKDVSSWYSQNHSGVRMESLSRWDRAQEEWREIVVEDQQSTPADVAAFRIDFGDFLRSLPRRNKRLALLLAKGHATSFVARRFGLSASRISQLRQELFDAWQEFQTEPGCG